MKSVTVYSQDGSKILHTYSDVEHAVSNKTTGEIVISKKEPVENEDGKYKEEEVIYTFSDSLPYIVYKPELSKDPSTYMVPETYMSKAFFNMLKASGIVEQRGVYVCCELIHMPKVKGYMGFLEYLSTAEKPKVLVNKLVNLLEKKIDELTTTEKEV